MLDSDPVPADLVRLNWLAGYWTALNWWRWAGFAGVTTKLKYAPGPKDIMQMLFLHIRRCELECGAERAPPHCSRQP
jgi:hypothetical protein